MQFRQFIINSIRQYQKRISPVFKKAGIRCIYKTTCSEYCIDCFKTHNMFKAFILCAWRILSCNPLTAYLASKKFARRIEKE